MALVFAFQIMLLVPDFSQRDKKRMSKTAKMYVG